MKKIFLFFLPVFIFGACMQYTEPGKENKKSTSWLPKDALFPEEDEFYTLFHMYDLKPSLTNIRPAKSDSSIQFCIPSAFTVVENDSIDGLFIVDGKIISRKVNHTLGGGLIIRDHKIFILKTNNSELLTEKWIDSVANLKQSFLQQIQLIRKGEALEFHKDQKLFQRRAIVSWDGISYCSVVQSKNEITLQDFADDLKKMKVVDAIYTDMGSFDEGWYRSLETKATVKIGKNCSQTSQQSNWLIFSL
jgi:hypothetical protein